MNRQSALKNTFRRQAIKGKIRTLAATLFRLGPPSGKSCLALRPEFASSGHDGNALPLAWRRKNGGNFRRLHIEQTIMALLREYDAFAPETA